MVIKRVKDVIRRKQAANKLGVRFDRGATFALPGKMMLAGSEIGLDLPQEHGVKMAFIDILLDDCYLCASLFKEGRPVKTILDIGANVGLFGLYARNVFTDALIHAYEPNPFLEQYLSSQAASANFQYFMEAVGIENGYVSLDFDGESVLTKSKSDSSGKIPQVSFRQAIDRLGGNVDFLKMDCEGAEWEIFKDHDSWKNVQHLSMEYHLFDGHSVNELQGVVQALGFNVSSIRPCEGFGLLTASKNLP